MAACGGDQEGYRLANVACARWTSIGTNTNRPTSPSLDGNILRILRERCQKPAGRDADALE
jgi:hypothetical protein